MMLLELIYLLASLSFIMGLKMLSHPETARNGNRIAAVGMGLAIIGTLFLPAVHGGEGPSAFKLTLILGTIGLGLIAGWQAAVKVKMTAMPELVSLFNGMGGACAALIGLVEYPHYVGDAMSLSAISAGLLIGAVSFSGSVIAWAKLNGKIPKPIALPYYNIVNTLILILSVGLAAALVMSSEAQPWWLYALLTASLAYGVLFVLPIGGADMPVVISLLNSFTGVAAAFGGLLYGNMVMLTGGVLVGSAGTLLTVVMCKAMNRPLSGVLFGSFGGSASGAASEEGGSTKEISLSDTAVLLNYSQKVVVVPGYGLAVAQAQHVCHEIEKVLGERGVDVRYGIHPVAGRMPGHMNVLLAEADVAYDKLMEMEEINPLFPQVDVVLVIGANDVVNPAAHDDPASPIYGMPILEVQEAKHVIVIKRGMAAGYAGIENSLFFKPKTSMLFGDAKKVLTAIATEIKQMG